MRAEPRVVLILMVEDDPMQQSVLKMLFTKANDLNAGFVSFAVTAVGSGTDALASVRAQEQQGRRKFDLILLDFVLGDMTGDHMVKPLREMLGDGAAIVMTSAHGEARQASLDSGADVFLQKPLGTHVIQHIWQFLKDTTQLRKLCDEQLTDSEDSFGRSEARSRGDSKEGSFHQGGSSAAEQQQEQQQYLSGSSKSSSEGSEEGSFRHNSQAASSATSPHQPHRQLPTAPPPRPGVGTLTGVGEGAAAATACGGTCFDGSSSNVSAVVSIAASPAQVVRRIMESLPAADGADESQESQQVFDAIARSLGDSRHSRGGDGHSRGGDGRGGDGRGGDSVRRPSNETTVAAESERLVLRGPSTEEMRWEILARSGASAGSSGLPQASRPSKEAVEGSTSAEARAPTEGGAEALREEFASMRLGGLAQGTLAQGASSSPKLAPTTGGHPAVSGTQALPIPRPYGPPGTAAASDEDLLTSSPTNSVCAQQ